MYDNRKQNTWKRTLGRLGLLGGAAAILSMLASACTTTGTTGTTSDSSSTIIFYAVILIGIVAYGYFLIYRPRKKQAEQQKKRIESQKRGDEIITLSGIYGTIETIEENSVVIKLESGATMRIARAAIAGKAEDVLGPGNTR